MQRGTNIEHSLHCLHGVAYVSHIPYCVYRDFHGWSNIIIIHKELFSFHFQFQFNLSSNDIKVENMSKSNCMQKIV